MMKKGKEPAAFDVLVDMLAGADFDHQILDAAESARIIIERLREEGFIIVRTSDRP